MTTGGQMTTTYLDPDGDLRLEIGPENAPFVVCSKALSRASPVFKSMLYGGFAESKPKKGEWVVKLPEDDVRAMSWVLSIIHGQFDKVPYNIMEDGLYRLTVVTDKYDLTASLRPWAQHWLNWALGANRGYTPEVNAQQTYEDDDEGPMNKGKRRSWDHQPPQCLGTNTTR